MALTGPVNNHGDGPQNAQIGDGSQYNNNDRGPQFNNSIFFGFNPFKNQEADDMESPQKEKQACLESLSFRNIDARQQDISSAHPMTCNWLFKVEQFQQWRDRTDISDHNGVLWIKGNPGTGKSTLMKHILGHCQQVFKEYIIVAHFFNARGDNFEKTSLGMLRSLLYQLLEKESFAYERFIPIFREKRRIYGRMEWEWREPELKGLLLSAIQCCQPKPLLLLIDALDECSESHVRGVVGFIEELSIKAVDAKTTLSICLSSRHYPHISMKKHLELVVETKKEHDEDIAIYVRDKLTKRDQEIEKGVLRKASGVFMWVVLIVTMLNKAYDEGKVESMHKMLRDVPSDLEELFENLLSQDNPDKPETIFMLLCVLFTRRPLSPEELYFAMVAGTNPGNLREWNASKMTTDDIRRRITNSSRGLIEVRRGQKETVQLIHESVNDFLFRNQRLQNLDPSLESNPIGISHDRLRSCCMSYIMMETLSLPNDGKQGKSLCLSYPFLKYASTYVLYHAEVADARGVGQDAFLQRLGDEHDTWKRLQLFHISFESFLDVGCIRGAELLYTLSAHGYYSLMKVLLDNGANISILGGPYGTALHVAAANNQEETLRILLNMGANVNAIGGIYGTALQAAVVRENETIVAMLLKEGAHADAIGGIHGTALQAAANNGNEEIVEILLEKRVNVNAVGGSPFTTLQVAAWKGNKNIVEMLLERGAEVNAQEGLQGTALQMAAMVGNEEISMILLKHGADANIIGGLYGTILQTAVVGMRKKKNSVATWLEKGVDINAVGGLYHTVLQAAAAESNVEVIETLLENGVATDTLGGLYCNAIQAAAAKGQYKVIETLLKNGANIDINAKGGLYGTALHAAAAGGEEGIVAMLLAKGADVNIDAVEGLYNTTLQAAMASRNMKIILMLLQNGADIDIDTSDEILDMAPQGTTGEVEEEIIAMLLERGVDINVNASGGLFGTALQAAAAEGKEEIVAMLLEKGADVNAREGVFGTALQVAPHKKTVEILLEKGADINAREGLNGTALQMALLEDEWEIATILLENGASCHFPGSKLGTEKRTGKFSPKTYVSWNPTRLLSGICLAFTGWFMVRFLRRQDVVLRGIGILDVVTLGVKCW